MKIALVVFDHFTDLDTFLPWDLLNRVRTVGGIQDWEVTIVGTKDIHTSLSGLRLPVMGQLEEIQDADAVLFTSGSIGVYSLLEDEEYLARLRGLLQPDKQWIGSMCSGAILLAHLGLLQGKKATTYPTVKQKLSSYGVEVVDEGFVPQGRIATAAGCLAGIDLSRWVISNLVGEEIVEKVLKSVQPVGVAGAF